MTLLADHDIPAWASEFARGRDRQVKSYNQLAFGHFWASKGVSLAWSEAYVQSDHLEPNIPLLLSSATTAFWPARHLWTAKDTYKSGGASRPDLTALQRYAHHVIPVANTRIREYTEFERTELPLGEVLDIWEAGDRLLDKQTDQDGSSLYVKDYHIIAEIEKEGRGAGEVYEVPECLRGASSVCC